MWTCFEKCYFWYNFVSLVNRVSSPEHRRYLLEISRPSKTALIEIRVQFLLKKINLIKFFKRLNINQKKLKTGEKHVVTDVACFWVIGSYFGYFWKFAHVLLLDQTLSPIREKLEKNRFFKMFQDSGNIHGHTPTEERVQVHLAKNKNSRKILEKLKQGFDSKLETQTWTTNISYF